jgi:hypothetical protein
LNVTAHCPSIFSMRGSATGMVRGSLKAGPPSTATSQVPPARGLRDRAGLIGIESGSSRWNLTLSSGPKVIAGPRATWSAGEVVAAADRGRERRDAPHVAVLVRLVRAVGQADRGARELAAAEQRLPLGELGVVRGARARGQRRIEHDDVQGGGRVLAVALRDRRRERVAARLGRARQVEADLTLVERHAARGRSRELRLVAARERDRGVDAEVGVDDGLHLARRAVLAGARGQEDLQRREAHLDQVRLRRVAEISWTQGRRLGPVVIGGRHGVVPAAASEADRQDGGDAERGERSGGGQRGKERKGTAAKHRAKGYHAPGGAQRGDRRRRLR